MVFLFQKVEVMKTLKMSDTLHLYEQDTQAALVKSSLIFVMDYS